MSSVYNDRRVARQLLERAEFSLIMVLCVICVAWITISGRFSDIESTPEALRYEYDEHAYFGRPEPNTPYVQKGDLKSNGTVVNGELSEVCGKSWYTNFYKPSNRHNRLALLDDCQLSAEKQQQVRQTIAGKTQTTQQQIRDKYSYFLGAEKPRKIEGNKSKFSNPKIEKDYFKESLSLDDNGKSAILSDIPKLLQDATEPKELLAILASIEGDTAFPYSQLYKDRPSIAIQLNNTADFMRKIARINTEWADKAVKTKKIVKYGAGVLTFLILWSYMVIRVVRRQSQPWVSLWVWLLGWTVIGFGLTRLGFYSISNTTFSIMLGASIGSLIFFNIPWIRQKSANYALSLQMPTTAYGYLFFVLCLWLGFAIMLELSVRGHIENRFLIIQHFDTLYWAFFAVTIAPAVANILAVFFSKTLAQIMKNVIWPKRTLLAWGVVVVLLLLVFVASYKFRARLSSNIFIELFKACFIFGLAWVITASRFSLQARSLSPKMYATFILIALIPVGMMLLIGEMGTVLVLLYSSTILAGAYWAYRFSGQDNATTIKQQMHAYGHSIAGNWLAILSSLLFIGVGTWALIKFEPGGRTAERVLSMLDPFNSSNDQMAIIHWLRHSTPMFGYSLGDIPWCGYNAGCAAPKQMQSDYTATSVVLLMGMGLAMVFFAAYLRWLLSFIKGHIDVNLGLRDGLRDGNRNLGQVFLLWSGIIWVVVTMTQMIVTVLGNFGILPLTGVTLPFLSYGKSSLIACSIFIGILINRPDVNQRQVGDI